VVDAGHPTERFTSSPPAEGSWDVPASIVRHDLPASWRFVLVTPAEAVGQSGTAEDESIRSIVERADPGIADDIAHLLTRRLLPAVAERDLAGFGTAVARLGRLNGAWYADEQGGVYRPPAGRLVDRLGDSQAIYGVTRERDRTAAVEAAEGALGDIGCEGTVRVVAPRNRGASLDDTQS